MRDADPNGYDDEPLEAGEWVAVTIVLLIALGLVGGIVLFVTRVLL